MPRYINEDEFIAWVKEHWCADCQNDNGLRCRACWIDDAIDIVEEAPEADVVPKIEVERLETEVRLLTENSISAKYPCCVSTSKGLILTKSLEEYDKLLADISSELAREIFAEIERLMLDGAIGGKYPAKIINPDKYAELKKKYTEGE